VIRARIHQTCEADDHDSDDLRDDDEIVHARRQLRAREQQQRAHHDDARGWEVEDAAGGYQSGWAHIERSLRERGRQYQPEICGHR
jgi:hypothetical protein